jgi:septal ring factor EnvC (AmiA/AmiB activator)
LTARIRLAVVLALASAVWRSATTEPSRTERLSAVQSEMKRLDKELAELSAKERGLLNDVARMDTEIALRRAQLTEVTLSLVDTEQRLDESERKLAVIEAEWARRAPRLAARLRTVYKQGPVGLLARTVAPLGTGTGLDGIRYASYLSRRDATQLSAWRTLSVRLNEERRALETERLRLGALQAESAKRADALAVGRASRASLLSRIRGDREQHEKAFAELSDAARSLGQLVDSLDDATPHVALDARKFRGLLDWPAAGAVSSGFGTVVHPKFKTKVPHPGLDIDAPEGEPFRSVFEGRVAFAAALVGYGLTAVVDHGNGIVSVYAHAGVLLVSAGQDVTRGQELGRVGDSGSLRGPYLYFELRDTGRPVDPASWLRRR